MGSERPAAVVFDCDGVLVDSEVLVTRIEAELLRGLGVPVTAQEVAARFVGLSDVEMDTLIEAEWGLVLPPAFTAAKLERIAAVLEAELRPAGLFGRFLGLRRLGGRRPRSLDRLPHGRALPHRPDRLSKPCTRSRSSAERTSDHSPSG